MRNFILTCVIVFFAVLAVAAGLWIWSQRPITVVGTSTDNGSARIIEQPCSTPPVIVAAPPAVQAQPVQVNQNVTVNVDTGAAATQGEAPQAVAEATAVVEIVTPEATPATETAPIVAPPATCTGIAPSTDQSYVEAMLHPGQTFAGDIEIFIDNEWIQVHDSGIGEYTVVRNIGTTDVLTRGRWGAGCRLGTDQKVIVNDELGSNHKDLIRVRDVAVDGNKYVETMFTPAG